METAERVVSFLNTWEIPNKERTPKEHLEKTTDLAHFMNAVYPDRQSDDLLEEILNFRTGLRSAIEVSKKEEINTWISERDLDFTIKENGEGAAAEVRFYSKTDSLINQVLVDVLQLIQAKSFHRIKICPDCKWAFFDQSKSATKKWCSMNAKSPHGRACGTISKVKKYREKKKEEL
ncbi:CGNR zinc finger domain-containing protein [Metaplanococcus flavidus]|uniref:CGNR zinc finger domain-containing protein n=1 Tax=Metaplanococcus flavidus TaxID=569883 RepID=A0ABW3LGA6_9BACL